MGGHTRQELTEERNGVDMNWELHFHGILSQITVVMKGSKSDRDQGIVAEEWFLVVFIFSVVASVTYCKQFEF